MNKLNNNLEYWEGRHHDMTNERIVGRIDWTRAEYYKELARWSSIIEPLLSQVQLPRSSNNSTVLDIGCGVGRWVPLLSKYFTDYYGCDITDNAIEKTRKAVADTGLNYVVEKIVDNVLPFKNIKFDLVWTCVVLQHIVDKELLEYYAQQISYAVKPEGYLLITENIAECKDSHYMNFRSESYYKELFTSVGFNIIDTKYIEEREQHASMLFRKEA